MDIQAILKRINIVNRYKDLRSRGISEEETKTILSFMFELEPEGFEQYIRDYFDKIGHFDKITVTGGIHDKGVDVRGEKNNKYIAIQCKKFTTTRVTEKDILYFIEQTREIKERLGDTLSLYFITTNWINRQAWARATKNGIHMLYYRDILKINKILDINDFIKEHKKDKKIITGIDIYKVLSIYYYRKFLGRIFGDTLYFLERLLSRIINFSVDYDKVEKSWPEKEANQKLLEKTPFFDKKLSYN